MRKIKLTISYDGTNYCGWQIQAKDKTIQHIIRDAISHMTKEKISLVGSSRTDAGVHALGQVAHFTTKTNISTQAFVKGINSLIPEDIAVVEAKEVDLDFHAQKQAKAKLYQYVIASGAVRLPLMQDRCWQMRSELNLAAMEKAAKYLVGEHDFTSFQSTGSSAKDAVREIYSLSLRAQRSNPKDSMGLLRHYVPRNDNFYTISISGNGFLYRMVRNIVGLLVEIGRGKHSPEFARQVLQAKSKKKAGVCAPACGLYLIRIDY
ncbi:MAG: tRNA pseudouridine(38-40) synthase TruA [Pseudomonadota bacterium]